MTQKVLEFTGSSGAAYDVSVRVGRLGALPGVMYGLFDGYGFEVSGVRKKGESAWQSVGSVGRRDYEALLAFARSTLVADMAGAGDE